MNNTIISIIIEFVKGAQSGTGRYSCCINYRDDSGNYEIYNCKYLLAQILRHYKLPNSHYHVSEEAKKLWNELTSKSIMDYEYVDRIPCDRINGSRTISIYKGNNRNPEQNGIVIKKNDKVKYNDIFTDEHTVPIKVIVEKLLALNEPTEQDVKRILDHMHICKITKEEDRRIAVKYNRPFDYRTIVDSIYKPVGIIVLDE